MRQSTAASLSQWVPRNFASRAVTTVAVTVGIIVAAMGFAPSVVQAQTVPDARYTQAQTRVAVEGERRLNLHCVGEGNPTVLFDAGAGQHMLIWRHVQGAVATFTRACAYDRAGYGFSDAAPHASDARHAVEDLHRLITVGALPRPIVYVGHSLAGLYGTLLQATYPDDIAGAVLVDPSFADQWRLISADVPGATRAQAAGLFARIQSMRRACLALATQGELDHPSTTDARDCADTRGYPDALDDTLQRELTRQYARPGYFATSLSEYENFWPDAEMHSPDIEQLAAAGRLDFGRKPLIVLTHGKEIPLLPALDADQRRRADAAWVAGHLALAKSSTRGEQRIVSGAGHAIQVDQPTAVIDAIRRVAEMIRQDGQTKTNVIRPATAERAP
jgi:pimeloyl-ACP methyl ester carboxylesterase